MSICKNIARLWAWHMKFQKRKARKNELNEELMHIAWHPRTDFYLVMLLMYISSIETFCHTKICYSSNIFMNSCHFDTENYT